MVIPVATPMAKLIPNNAPEFRRLAPNILAGHDIDALHDAEQNRKTERQRHEEKMIHGGQAELQPGELHNVHGGAHGKMLLGCGLAVEAPIKCSCMLAASILGRCPGLNTNRAAARMIISLTATTKVTSGISGWHDMAGFLLHRGNMKLIWISSRLTASRSGHGQDAPGFNSLVIIPKGYTRRDTILRHYLETLSNYGSFGETKLGRIFFQIEVYRKPAMPQKTLWAY